MKSIKIFFFIIFIFGYIPSYSQKLESFKISKINLSNHSTENIDLPLWDDFSYSNKLNNLFWSDGKNVSIKDYFNIDAPSINVIEFDGLNNDGSPYSNDSGYGVCDVLVSDKINLSSKSLGDSIYLSFFWNFNINGEFPDYEDSLKIDFLNINNDWITVWDANGGLLNFKNQFTFDDILVENDFLHQNFMFKIYNKGNSEGPFDSWLIDYVYLDENRNKNDSIFLDRTLSFQANKIFKDHISIPYSHILSSNSFTDSVSIKINNLDKDIQPINYTLKSFFNNENNGYLIYDNEPVSPILSGHEERIINTKPIEVSNFLANNDSTSIEILFYIESGDSSYINQDLRLNDTMRFNVFFNNSYSYDDGSAEFAAGLNQKNSELVLKHRTFTEDTLTHIEIYFPNNLYSSYSSDIELLVYKNLDNENSKIVSQLSSVNFNDNFNLFELNNPIIVKDSFYIGFRQFENSFLPVGLDKNSSTSEKIYYKVDNNWFQNDVIKGSLMIRPVFSKSDYVLTDLENEKLKKSISIFPNPSRGIFNLSEKVKNVIIYSIDGKIIKSINNTNSINLKEYKSGYYLIQIFDKNRIERHKLIKY
tara:strand:+ start:1656 stop:3425 length:1770 start_codon:yes stop_codon:yes gene_type:complete